MASKPRWSAWQKFLVFITAVLLLRQLWWALFGYLNVDEFENLHLIWLLDHGQWPTRDFFHTHPIIYNFLLYPLYAWKGPSAQLPGLVRLALFPLVLLLTWQVGWLAKKSYQSETAGWLAVIFFLSSPTVGRSVAEMRPDAVSVPLALAGVMAFLAYAQKRDAQTRLLYLSALFFGLGFLFTQKCLFIFLATLWMSERCHSRLQQLSAKDRIKRIAVFSLIAVAPIALYLAIPILLDQLIFQNFLLLTVNALPGPQSELLWQSRLHLLKLVPAANIVLLALGLYACRQSRFWRERQMTRAQVGPHLFAAIALISVVFTFATPALVGHFFVLPFLFLSLVAAGWLARKTPKTAIAVLLLALVTANSIDYRNQYLKRDVQEEIFQYVLKEVPEDRPVLDMLSGFGAFRPIVGRYIYYRAGFWTTQHPMYIPHEIDVARAVVKREYGAVVDFHFLRRYAPASIVKAIEENYRPGENPHVYLPKPPP